MKNLALKNFSKKKFEDFSFRFSSNTNKKEDNKYDLNNSIELKNLKNNENDISNKNNNSNNKNNKKKIEFFKNLNEPKKNKIPIKKIKYSNKESQTYSNFIYQYFYDKFTDEDYNNSSIILFFGDNLEEKKNTINAFLNIIKGIKLEKNERLILIGNNKLIDKQYATGIHIYYLKNYKNKPVILVDCIDYGNTKNIELDDNILEAFSYIFKDLIKHINLVCFIIKESDEKLNIFYHYIIGCVTSLFSENIIQNFVFLVTNIDKDYIKQIPLKSATLLNDIYYDYIKYKIDKKWFNSINSERIFSNEIKELSKYSYEQLIELIKKSLKIKILTLEFIIKSRLDIKYKVNNIISSFKILKSGNDTIPQMLNISYDEEVYEKDLKNSEKDDENKIVEIDVRQLCKNISEMISDLIYISNIIEKNSLNQFQIEIENKK